MVHFQLEDFDNTIQDCNRAIELDPNLVKAHYRKGRALYEQINVPGAAQKAIESLEKAHQLDQTIPELNDLLDFAREELKEDEYIPVPAEQVRFQTMFDWMLEGGANFDKLKMRYYAPDYRGVHASRNIKKGETILYVPKHEIITLEMAMESPIGSQMAARNFRQRLISPKHSFLATYVM